MFCFCRPLRSGFLLVGGKLRPDRGAGLANIPVAVFALVNQRIDAVVELDERDNVVRYIISNIEHGIEVCPHCGGESSMHSEFRAQHCTECGEIILPCHLCECANCKECPLKGENRKYIGGIKPNQTNCSE